MNLAIANKFHKNYTQSSYKIFCVLWAIAILFDKSYSDHWNGSIYNLMLVFAAIYLLFRPSSGLIFLAIFQIIDYISETTIVANHVIFITFTNGTIIFSWLVLIFLKKSFLIDRTDLFSAFAPLLRIELLLLYFFATLHKLNTDFLSLEVSCGSELYLDSSNRPYFFVFLPKLALLQSISIYATIIIEGAIPILLLFRRTRNVGILLGLLFHSLLSFNPRNGFFTFSSMLFAMFSLFMTEKMSDKFELYLSKFSWKYWFYKFQDFSLFLRILIYVILLALSVGSLSLAAFLFKIKGLNFQFPFWITYNVIIINFALRQIIKREAVAPDKKNIFSFQHPILILMPILVFLNGFSPYLGLKTESTFSMFSNLRTEGNTTNHLFIPANWQIFDFQKDLVEITGSSEKYLKKIAKNKQLIPFFQLRSYLTDKPEASVSYIRKGVEIKLDRVAQHPEILPPVPYWQQRWFVFRPIDKNGPQKCGH